MKICSKCLQEKTLNDFRNGQGYRGGYRRICKDCEYASLKAWRESNPTKKREQFKRKYLKNKNEGKGYFDPEKKELFAMQKKDAYLKRKYGLSLSGYIELREKQEGKCAICLKVPVKLEVVTQGRKPELVVDHDHTTGKVRSLLCNGCNVAIAHAKEDIETLKNMITYIQKN